MAAWIWAQSEVYVSGTGGILEKVMKLMRSFGLSEQRKRDRSSVVLVHKNCFSFSFSFKEVLSTTV